MKKLILLSAALLFGLGGCIENDHFGLLTEAEILSFDIQGQLSNKINTETCTVTITVPSTYMRNELKVTRAVCTQLARFSTDPYSVTDFTYPIEFEITAENDKVSKAWTIKVFYEEGISQLPFSAMDEWTVAKYNGKDITYKEGNQGEALFAYFPGNGTDLSPWQSAAYANTYLISKIYTMTTSPYPTWAVPEYARMETIWSKNTPMNAQIVTGALFTGQFGFNIIYASQKKPRKMINIGTPFQIEPNAIRFKMRYKPGNVMRDGTGAEITVNHPDKAPLVDSCDIYALLHNRTDDPDAFIRIGAAHLRTGETIGDMNDDRNGFVEVTVPFVYGQPDAAALAEKPYLKIGGTRGELTFYKFPMPSYNEEPHQEIYTPSRYAHKVDHITVLFSSSTYGDNFWGAVNDPVVDLRGSTLDIKDFELVYD